MSACLSVVNLSKIAVSVYIDDDTFSFLLPGDKTICKSISAGSISLKVLNSRDKIILDSWLSIKPETRHILEIFDTKFSFKSIPRS